MIALLIGVHDGGPDALRERLSLVAEALEAHGVLVYDGGRGVSADDLQAWNSIRALADSKPEAIVLASVADAVLARPDALADRIADLSPRIVWTQGDVADHAVGLYRSETLSGANRDDFDQFFQRKMAAGAFDAAALETWAAAFGEEALRFVALEATERDEALGDVLEAVGLGPKAREAVTQSAPARPAEPGWAILEIVRSLSAEVSRRAEMEGLDPASAHADLAGAAREVEANMGEEGVGLYLSADQIAALAGIRRTAAQALAACGGSAPTAPEIAPRAFLPEVSAIPADRLNPLLIEMTAALVHGGIIAPKLKRRAARIEKLGPDHADPPAGPGKREGPMARGLAKAKKRAKRRKQSAKGVRAA